MLGVPPLLKPYADAKSLAEFCKKEVQDALAANPEASTCSIVVDSVTKHDVVITGLPKICIIGAKGRCGGGAAYVADLAGIPLENMMLWDIEETKKGGTITIVFVGCCCCCCCCCCLVVSLSRCSLWLCEL